jgi:glycyl-tRNA synthetase beta chain
MGGYYARAEGLPDAVADAIRDHYKPVGQGDDVPTAPVTVAVSLADKLDTIATFFVEGMLPSGSKDPFALRRAALAIIRLLFENEIRCNLDPAIAFALAKFLGHRTGLIESEAVGEALEAVRKLPDAFGSVNVDEIAAKTLAAAVGRGPATYADVVVPTIEKILDFFADRLTVQQREAGIRHDLIDAVFALGGEDDLVRLLARVKALQAFVMSEDGVNLLAGYKRAANILKKESPSSVIPAKAGIPLPSDGGDEREIPAFAGMTVSYTPEPAEAALIAALESAEPRATAAIAAEDFAGAMTALATLRGPIDAFFTDVTVNDVNPEKRLTRLAILEKIRAAVHKVADFSKIEG